MSTAVVPDEPGVSPELATASPDVSVPPDETTPPAATTEASPTGTTERPRDDRGRFTTGQPAASPAPAAAEPSGQPDGVAPAAPAATTATVPPAQSPQAPAVSGDLATDRTVKVNGQTYELPGLAEVKAEHWPQLREIIGQGIKYQVQRQELQNEQALLTRGIREFVAEVEAQRAHNKAFTDRLAEIESLRDENEAAEWGIRLWAEFPVLKQRGEIARDRAALDAQRRALEPDPQVEQSRVEQLASQEMDQLFGYARQQPTYASLTPQDWQELEQQIAQDGGRYIYQAPQDVPEYGVKRGDWVVDQDRFHAAVKERARWRDEIKQTEARVRAEAQKIGQAKAANAAVKESVAVPPTVSAAASAPSSTGSTTIKSREDWERFKRGY